MINWIDMIKGFKELGLYGDDTVLVHSSLKSFGPIEHNPASSLYHAFKDVLDLDRDGTLLVPTFNFGFCQGEVFDVYETPSKMGYFTEFIRKHPRALRSRHPIYSFAGLGTKKEYLLKTVPPSSYGSRSVFGRLTAIDGKIMIIGLPWQNSMTYFHHIEEVLGVPYRGTTTFTGNTIDLYSRAPGNQLIQTSCTMYTRNPGVVTDVEGMGMFLESLPGVVRQTKIGEATVKLMRARDVFRYTSENMDRIPLYKMEEA